MLFFVALCFFKSFLGEFMVRAVLNVCNFIRGFLEKIALKAF